MGDIPALQRDLLAQLLSLQCQQEQALVDGDMATLCSLSETRLSIVREASSLLLHQGLWAPDLLGPAAELRQRTADLERALRARRDAVSRQMARLTEGRRAADYLVPVVGKRTPGWTA